MYFEWGCGEYVPTHDEHYRVNPLLSFSLSKLKPLATGGTVSARCNNFEMSLRFELLTVRRGGCFAAAGGGGGWRRGEGGGRGGRKRRGGGGGELVNTLVIKGVW